MHGLKLLGWDIYSTPSHFNTAITTRIGRIEIRIWRARFWCIAAVIRPEFHHWALWSARRQVMASAWIVMLQYVNRLDWCDCSLATSLHNQMMIRGRGHIVPNPAPSQCRCQHCSEIGQALLECHSTKWNKTHMTIPSNSFDQIYVIWLSLVILSHDLQRGLMLVYISIKFTTLTHKTKLFEHCGLQILSMFWDPPMVSCPVQFPITNSQANKGITITISAVPKRDRFQDHDMPNLMMVFIFWDVPSLPSPFYFNCQVQILAIISGRVAPSAAASKAITTRMHIEFPAISCSTLDGETVGDWLDWTVLHFLF